MRHGKGDLTIVWSEDKHAEMIEHIQALIEKGIRFYIKAESRAALGRAIRNTAEIKDRRVLILDAEIAKLLKDQIERS